MTPHSIRLAALPLLATLSTPALAADVTVRLDAGNGFNVRDNTGTVNRLRVDEATGNVSRNGVLFVHTTGFNNDNLFVGPGAGNPSPSFIFGNHHNTAFGQNALGSNNSGIGNTAAGADALHNNNNGSLNTAVGYRALRHGYSGNSNTAVGASALENNAGSNNAAFGEVALTSNTTGSDNTAVGTFALLSNTTGASNTAAGFYALGSNSTASNNTAAGFSALRSNTTGILNVAAGSSALRSNTTGGYNTAVGAEALLTNTTGYGNSATGALALRSNTSGEFNTATGAYALANSTTGTDNTAMGFASLLDTTTGARNLAVGSSAGRNQTTGNDNIYIANEGVAGESGRIKIGRIGIHTQAHMAGIHGATSAGGIAVLVNASGVLGTTTSSARFKQDVRDMGDASDLLMRLRPVTFRYTEDAVGADESKTPQYGLIAEEVAEVAPELVAPDLDGKPYSVKYHELPALLLNEVQEQEKALTAQSRLIAEQRQQIAALAAEIELLKRR